MARRMLCAITARFEVIGDRLINSLAMLSIEERKIVAPRAVDTIYRTDQRVFKVLIAVAVKLQDNRPVAARRPR